MNVSDVYSFTYAYGLYSTTNHELLAYGPDSSYACTECSQPYSQDVTRSVTNHFNHATGFSTYVHADSMVSSVGAELTLFYLIGTSRTWSFTLQNTYI